MSIYSTNSQGVFKLEKAWKLIREAINSFNHDEADVPSSDELN